MSDFLTALAHRVLVSDGAMGTAIHARPLSLADFDGHEGCSEILCLTRPDVVRQLHDDYLAVGCDCLETNAFGAGRVVLAEYGLADESYRLARAAAEIARQAAAAAATPDWPRFVLGNIGPGTKLPSLGHIGFDELVAANVDHVRGLVDGGVDALIVETVQDILQAKAVLAAIDDVCAGRQRPPVIVQVTLETSGTMLLGTELGAALTALLGYDIQVFGLNCATGPEQMLPHLRYLAEHCPLPLSVMPNAGLPQVIEGRTVFPLRPAELAEWLERFVDELGVNLVGGCCGTTPEHLARVVERLGERPAPRREVTFAPSLSSLYARETIEQENSFLIVGERCNTNGSKKFRELLVAGDVDGLVGMAREQLRGGAQALDVCVDYVGRDGVADMELVMSRFASQVNAPLVVDSTEPEVIEAALKRLGGKSAINSVNLEAGPERARAVFALARRYNAAVVALTIDEEGMARTAERKAAVARRLYDLAVTDCGLPPGNLLFDVLTLPVTTGAADERRNALETIDGVRRVKESCPGAFTILGVSNVSFGLSPAARQALNSVFLHECLTAGLDAAIVHASKILPLYRLDDEQVAVARELLYDRREAGDPLPRFMALFAAEVDRAAAGPVAELSLEDELARRIVDGERPGLEELLERALTLYDPLTIINEHLLRGMQTVGELFGSGRMQLPFVLQSAEVMKAAVACLEPYLARSGGGTTKGTLVLATVKGDVHDIGKNLVDIILSNNGYKVVNLGIKQPLEQIAAAALEHQADAIGLSGLLVKSTLVMREDLRELNRRGLHYFPVICGGAALTREYVERDLRSEYAGRVFYGQDAFEGLAVMNEVCSPESRARRRAALRRPQAVDTPLASAVEVAPGVSGEGRSDVATDVPIPAPPFEGTRVLTDAPATELFEYVNPLALYGGQYRLRRRPDETRAAWWERVRTGVEPAIDRLKQRILAEELFHPRAIYGFLRCRAEGNRLVVVGETGAEVVFDLPRQPAGRRLCLSDFVRPAASGETDWLAVQVVTLGQRVAIEEQALFAADRYTDYLYFHGLAVETTEAFAEWLHRRIRREWGLAGGESEGVEGLFRQAYRGRRYSFGYPACPDLEAHVPLFELLRPERIGVSLSEEFMLVPEVSTAALVLHHPEARYFTVAEGTVLDEAKA